jgi:signal transduction histidine kinase
LSCLIDGIRSGAGAAIVTEESFRDEEPRALIEWVAAQPAWSTFPFIVLTHHGGGLERNLVATRLTRLLGNVAFLERPFHPTTLVSVAQSALQGRLRQYECRRLNEELEDRVQERTAELATANQQLLAQIDERERVEDKLRRMQRLEAVGQLTSGVAHDFNNLLTVVLGNIGFLERQFAAAGIDGKIAQRLAHMRTAAERGAKLTDQLLSFSRRQRLEPKALNLNESLAGMSDLLQSTMGGSISITTKLSPDLWTASVDPTQLELAVLNLAINARDAMGVGGTLTVSTRNATVDAPINPEEPPAGEYVEVCVSDTGSGMSDETRKKVFEPFFTTKEVGKGSGLGLSQVLGFAQQSGGGVRISSRVGQGTSIHIYLPRAATEPTAEPQREAAACADGTTAKILLVDDDNAVRTITADTLRELGYDVTEAGSAAAAFEILRPGSNFDLLILDFAMPEMSGADLARQIRPDWPDLPIIFITGFAERGALEGFLGARIVSKPFLNNELVDSVRLAVNRH